MRKALIIILILKAFGHFCVKSTNEHNIKIQAPADKHKITGSIASN